MNIGKLSKLSGISSKTIRYYEDIGLLPKAVRESNGYRMYSQTDMERVKLVAGARRLDISIAEIQEILEMRDRQEAPCVRLLELISRKREEVQLRMKQLKQMDAELASLHKLGTTFPLDDIEGKNCVCHLVSEQPN